MDFRSTGIQISGKTGTNGVATLETSRASYTQPGAPVGQYRVQLAEELNIEMRELPGDAPGAEITAWKKEYEEKADKLRSFPKALNSADKSPLEMDITASVAAEFDVSTY
ncbi:MAG: hypothetical protein FWH27_04900 [Planctomycetaceae bacterium]|nr:hypothetical protein [Planctomycetaceae bacterium]